MSWSSCPLCAGVIQECDFLGSMLYPRRGHLCIHPLLLQAGGLYWLPYYINSVTIASTKLSPQVRRRIRRRVLYASLKSHLLMQVA